MTRVVAAGLSKHYTLGGGVRRLALQDIDLEIDAGEFVCLLGPSGCGKTTLLNILSGLEPDFEGEVRFGSAAEPVVSYMFQEPRLLPWLSVADNLRFVLDGNARRQHDRIEGWLGRVGLGGYGGYYPGQLSTGMQQRLAVARALIIGPDLLFMDEPFSALDELTALSMRGELLGLWAEQRCTVVFVTHNPLEAAYLADRVLLLTPRPGRVAEELHLGPLLPRPRDAEDLRLWQVSRRLVRALEYFPANLSGIG